MKAGARVGGAGALIFGLILGCHASVSADAKVNGEGASADGEADLHGSAEREGEGQMTRQLAASPAGPNEGAGAGTALLGARHDLTLRSGQGSAACQCLAVALGGTHEGAMLWSGQAPNIDETSQLSIALSSEGQACQGEPKGSLGASYWGYRIAGNDVVVLVEAARSGRPLTTGAIIPRPVGSGQVFVAPASKKLPYGRPLEGTGLCKLGNPGPPRTAAFTELEVGHDAPSAGAPGGPRAISDQTDDMPATIELPAN